VSLVIEGFAGPGGWSEGLKSAGFTGTAVGFELDWSACRTAAAAGHARVQADVSALSLAPFAGKVDGVVQSPPCPPWSQSGKRLGPADRDGVLERIDAFAHDQSPAEREWNDPRSFLCADPMRWAVALRPRWIALEQVPGALPLWRHIGGHLENLDYSVATGVLRCEEYGVPQTRRRAVLVARRDGIPAELPAPTHRCYQNGAAQREGDVRLLPWVSMHDAIGWGLRDRPAWTVTGGGTATGGAEVFGNAKCRALLGGRRPTHAEAAALQGFRPDYPFYGETAGRKFQQIGDAVPPLLAAAVLAPLVQAMSMGEVA
jgi:DNA (cytosine-5)-methyltransferase 1